MVILHGFVEPRPDSGVCLPVPINCSGSSVAQHGRIELFLQLEIIPYFQCPPLGSGFAATTGTRDLASTGPSCHVNNEGREQSTPTQCPLEVGAEDLPT